VLKFLVDEGHLKVLQYLRANGCPWDKSMRENAEDVAGDGDNEVSKLLEWARANGCP
jgi:hypothetical protein